ncbi:unnamed protein product, partial [Prorocentrum cordatum]
VWQPVEVAAARGHAAGTRCTCGAVVFGSLEPLVVAEPCITARPSRTPMRSGAQPCVPNELEAHASGDGAGDEQDEGVAASAVEELGRGAAPCMLDDEADGDLEPAPAQGAGEAVFDDNV